jgi:hypothetical protein
VTRCVQVATLGRMTRRGHVAELGRMTLRAHVAEPSPRSTASSRAAGHSTPPPRVGSASTRHPASIVSTNRGQETYATAPTRRRSVHSSVWGRMA